MQKRRVGPFEVTAIGYGCMNLSHGYGPPLADSLAEDVLLKALDLGVDLFDTAMLYGGGLNEHLVGRILKPRRDQITLCTKGGMALETDPGKPKRRIDSRPQVIRENCEESLKRLQTDVIDLYYLHRWDKKTPIEEVIGAMARLIEEGKVKRIGLSEVSADTLTKAHAVHPITAVQSEYSLWTRNPEIALSQKCQELGVALVAFSPLGRGFLAGLFQDSNSVDQLHNDDMRKKMPRFSEENFTHNLSQYRRFETLAKEARCTPAQLALAWLLSRSDHVIPIPGARQIAHLEENMMATDIEISELILKQTGEIINQHTIRGCRYDPPANATVDTEEFPSESLAQ
jgi:aryl-alcohol dehydrogenase-like predicted oxidoreductase